MSLIRRVAVLALCGALAGCGFFGGGDVATSPSLSPSPSWSPSWSPSARAGFGGPAGAVPAVADIDDVIFQTPSRNIFCHLGRSGARCDIIRRSWKPPAKPADCELDWGNGMYLSSGKAGITCTGDSLIAAATTTLEYGQAYRSGDVLCRSDATGLTCKDETTGRGFTLAVARYSLF